ncbi:hypothetical protein F5148DRAFT_1291515 [Russula earlei]|uniref:Uncharacterized protein n=1 Tax=Russula earlei TaxID=71964 RepID=A0ACC0TV60_9AGAM|nr:hypothetical protein F5148DRAFT_1291515 [Russula earlei]
MTSPMQMPPCSPPLTFNAHSLSSTSDNVTTITSMSPAHAPPPVAFTFIPPAVIDPISPTAAMSLPVASVPTSVHAPASSAMSTTASTPPRLCPTSSRALTPASPTIITVAALVTPLPFVVSAPMPVLPTAVPSLSTTVPSIVAPTPSISAITPMLMPMNSHLLPMPLLPNHVAISYLPTAISLPHLVKDVIAIFSALGGA